MRGQSIQQWIRARLALLIVAGCATHSVSAAEFFLRAQATTKTMPNDQVIPMWGFARDSGFGTLDGTVTVPGPALVVPPGDTTLTIHVDNNLPVPISVVIPGQQTVLTPVKFTDPQGRQRVQSFTHETPPGNTTAVDYTWTNLRPGTYLYLSGSHPAVQVQMGLYGRVTRDAAPGQAYPAAQSAYDQEVVLLYSEVDPALHQAVAAGTYGTPPMSSTIDYDPQYFLINGEAYSAPTDPVFAGAANERVLVRFLNAGLRSQAPLLLGLHMQLLAEDGYPYSYPAEQCSLLLPAGKTVDAIVTSAANGVFPIFDRRLNLTNDGTAAAGGFLRQLWVGGTQFASDGFESGNFSGGTGWLGPWSVSGLANVQTAGPPHSGLYNARLRSNTGYIQRSVDLTGASNVHLRFWGRAAGLSGSDQAFVKVSPDGVNFTTVKTFTAADNSNSYRFYDIDLSGFTMTSNFRIAFDAEMNASTDRLFLDDISVIGLR